MQVDKRLSFILCYLLGLPLKVQAADWWLVAWEEKSTGDAIAYVDKSGIAKLDATGTLSAWSWTIYRADQTTEFGTYKSEKHKLVVDCTRQIVGVARSSFYSAFGSVVRQEKFDAPTLEPAGSGTPREAAMRFICAQGKPAANSLPIYDPSKDAEQRFWLRSRQSGRP